MSGPIDNRKEAQSSGLSGQPIKWNVKLAFIDNVEVEAATAHEAKLLASSFFARRYNMACPPLEFMIPTPKE